MAPAARSSTESTSTNCIAAGTEPSPASGGMGVAVGMGVGVAVGFGVGVALGGRGEGVFALSYSLRGRADEADVVVNPLSALAPGFLRRFVTLLERPATAGAAERERQPVAPPSPER